jgi:hypothetical protein
MTNKKKKRQPPNINLATTIKTFGQTISIVTFGQLCGKI